MKKHYLLFLLLVAILPHCMAQTYSPDANNILYVKQDAVGSAAGSSWANAVPDLADALKWANTNKTEFTPNNPLKIYVAKGTYYPKYSPIDGDNFTSTPNDRRALTFLMVANVALYGGFAGNESNLDQRDFGANQTILSGDLNKNDAANIAVADLRTDATRQDNAYHVLVTTTPTNLDGFTITAGNANNSINTNYYSVNGTPINSSNGGGIYAYGYVNLINSNVNANFAYLGGGIYADATLTLVNSNVNANSADYGGGIYAYAYVNLINSNVNANSATNNGGGIYTVGAVNLINSNVIENKGGNTIYFVNRTNLKVHNSIIYKNTNSDGSNYTNPADWLRAPSAGVISDYKNSLIQGNTHTTNNNIADTNLTLNSLFTDAINGDYSLATNSPLLNKGDNNLYTGTFGNTTLNSTTDKDLAGTPRLFNTTIDIGAYESQLQTYSPDGNNILYVKQDAVGNGTGSSWANAVPDLADALKWANTNKTVFTPNNPLKIYVAKGTYYPKYSPIDGDNFTSTPNDRRALTFLMVANVALYGGFAGNESNLDQRDFVANQTILSGDLNKNDAANIAVADLRSDPTRQDNAYHVLVTTTPTNLNGFTITAGNANNDNNYYYPVNGTLIYSSQGGGIYAYGNVNLINSNVNANYAYQGGGIRAGGTLTLVNSNVSANSANFGGGIYAGGAVNLINSSVNANYVAFYGGGIYADGTVNLINSSVNANSATNNGGGIYTVGAVNLINSNVIENKGPYTIHFAYHNTLNVHNSIIFKNTNSDGSNYTSPTGWLNAPYGVTPDYKNSLIQGNTNTTNNNIADTNLTLNSLFTDAINGDYSLARNSPLLNKGDNNLYTGTFGNTTLNSTTDKDLAGNPRLFNTTIDIGAYEKNCNLTITESTTNVSCNNLSNGAINLNLIGGTTPYSYLWNDGETTKDRSNLLAGTYTVTVTDTNGCQATKSFTITQPAALVVSKSQTNVSCNGGSNGTATVTASGGTGTYTYSWAPTGGTAATATGLTAGTYTVTVTDANNCQAIQNFTITQPAAIVTMPSQTNVSCNGGSNGTATVTASGGTNAYTYSWSPTGGTAATATGLTAGTYTVTVTDANSCQAIQNFTITQPAATPAPTAVNQAFCVGDNATIADLAANGTAIKWYNSATATTALSPTEMLVSGIYYATQTVNGCESGRTSISVTVNNTPAPTAANQAFCVGDNATIADLVANGTAIKWYNSATATTALSPTEMLVSGIYYATQTVNGCESASRAAVSVSVNNIAAPQVTNQTFCQAATVANLPQGNGYYNWYDSPSGATPLASTTPLKTATYYVTETNTICESNRTPVNVTIGTNDLVKQKWNDVLVFNNISNKYIAWQWYYQGQAITGATGQYYNSPQPLNGTYFVKATMADGTTIQTCPITMTMAKNIKAITLTPNPVQSGQMLTIHTKYSDTELQGAKIIVTDITGKNILQISSPKTNTIVQAPSAVTVYMVTLILANGEQHTDKFAVH